MSSSFAKPFLALIMVSIVIMQVPLYSLPNGDQPLAVSHPAAPAHALIPSHGIGHVNTGGKGNAVNPYALYSGEPAPMGIADFGVGPGNTPYYYNTTAFLGIAKINSLSVRGLPSSGRAMSFQLNVILQFNTTLGSYDYWIQDVAEVNTTQGSGTGVITIWNNIWNMSASPSTLNPNSLHGNGSIYLYNSADYFYYDGATTAGSSITSAYPTTLQFLVKSYQTTYGGKAVPAVSFTYNDGYGWQTFDNVYFQFATSMVRDNGFVVNGNSYNPYRTFFDAELVMGGPYSGYNTTDKASSVNFSLEYYNGHNFKEISNAYDFGSDTAEAMSNVLTTDYFDSSTGQFYLSDTAGSGSLTRTYSSSYSSWMTVIGSISKGYLYVNGTNVTEFVNDLVNVTMAPGTYHFSIWDASTKQFITVGSGSFTLLPGKGVTYELSTIGSYNVTFAETGLAPGTTWYVNLSNHVNSGGISGVTYTVSLFNGTYTYRVSDSGRLYHPVYANSFVVEGKTVLENISFTPVMYNVTFMESGLPTGTAWYLNLSTGQANASVSSNVSAAMFNGTYTYTVASSNKMYEPSAFTGAFTVSGNAQSIQILFSPVEYVVDFIQAGVHPPTWSITITNSANLKDTITGAGDRGVLLSNGTYSYFVSSENKDYAPSAYSGSFNVQGSRQSITITFHAVNYTVYFNETGLPKSASWIVDIGGHSESSTGTSIHFNLTNGTYSAGFPSSSLYYADTGNLSFKVAGKNATFNVKFSEYSFITGSITPSTASIYINGNPVSHSGTFNFTVKNGTYTVSSNDSGYHGYNQTVKLAPGQKVTINIVLSKIQSTSSFTAIFSHYFEYILISVIALVVLAGAALVGHRRDK